MKNGAAKLAKPAATAGEAPSGAPGSGLFMERSQSRLSLSASFEALAIYFPCMNSFDEEDAGTGGGGSRSPVWLGVDGGWGVEGEGGRGTQSNGETQGCRWGWRQGEGELLDGCGCWEAREKKFIPADEPRTWSAAEPGCAQMERLMLPSCAGVGWGRTALGDGAVLLGNASSPLLAYPRRARRLIVSWGC